MALITGIINIKKDECNHIDLARLFGIYLVILGHLQFNENNIFIKNIIYSFHMPLFFYLSGYLHKVTHFSIQTLKKTFISLIIPYFIYNFFYFLPYLLFKSNSNINLEYFLNTIFVKAPINIPTWFFVSLFWVKILSFFCKNKLTYFAVSMLLIFMCYFKSLFSFFDFFGLKWTLMAFPFFSFGYLSKDLKIKLIKPFFAVLLILIVIFFLVLFVYVYGRVDMYRGEYKNLFFYFLIGTIASFSIIYFSNYVPLKNNFIKTISRGTMIIVGTHWIAKIVLNRFASSFNIFTLVIISLSLIIIYYKIIVITYNKFPILYGKNNNNAKS